MKYTRYLCWLVCADCGIETDKGYKKGNLTVCDLCYTKRIRKRRKDD